MPPWPTLLVASLAALPARATTPASLCLKAARVAELRWGLPQGLLAAIGEVESGRPDPATRTIQPWPWSANVAGADYAFASAGEAGVVVDFFRERGVASIDVGCFQVNLRAHPSAFASPRDGFDPMANADYAARFLRALHDRSGLWTWAIAAYHSAEPAEGEPYRARVLRAWLARGAAGATVAADALTRIPVYDARTLPAALRATLLPSLVGPRARMVNGL